MSHRFVKSVVILDNALFLDGEQFPFYIAEDSLTVEESTEHPDFLKILNVRVMVPVGEGWGDELATIEDRRTPELHDVAKELGVDLADKPDEEGSK